MASVPSRQRQRGVYVIRGRVEASVVADWPSKSLWQHFVSLKCVMAKKPPHKCMSTKSSCGPPPHSCRNVAEAYTAHHHHGENLSPLLQACASKRIERPILPSPPQMASESDMRSRRAKYQYCPGGVSGAGGVMRHRGIIALVAIQLTSVRAPNLVRRGKNPASHRSKSSTEASPKAHCRGK